MDVGGLGVLVCWVQMMIRIPTIISTRRLLLSDALIDTHEF